MSDVGYNNPTSLFCLLSRRPLTQQGNDCSAGRDLPFDTYISNKNAYKGVGSALTTGPGGFGGAESRLKRQDSLALNYLTLILLSS